MSGRKHTRRTVVAALVALTAVLIPAAMASGSHDNTPIAGGDPSVVLLTLGAKDEVSWQGQKQAITTSRKTCTAVAFAASPALLSVTAIGGVLGEVKDGLGVKSGKDGNGASCGRVDFGESLSVALGSELDGYLMSAIDVDLELKFEATVRITFKHDGVTITTDTFGGKGGPDDGPDSKDGDNYRYFARPTSDGAPLYFDEVVFEAVAGSFSLEGGADGTTNGSLASNNSSQFEVVALYDGQITCGDEVTISDASAPGVVAVVTMQSLNLSPGDPSGWDALCAQLKNYNQNVTPTSLLFAPALAGSNSRFTLTITAENQPITTGGDGQITSLVMEYNDGSPGAVDQPLLPCEAQPVFAQSFWEQADTGLLPAGESACHYGVSVTPTGTGTGGVVGTEVWKVYFEDDPAFLFR